MTKIIHQISPTEREHLIADVVRWANDCVTNAPGWSNSYRCFREFLLLDKRCNEDIMGYVLNSSYDVYGKSAQVFIECNWQQAEWENHIHKNSI